MVQRSRRRSSSREPAPVTRSHELPVSAGNPELAGFKGRLHTVKVRLLLEMRRVNGELRFPLFPGRPRSSSWKMARPSQLPVSRSRPLKASAGTLPAKFGRFKGRDKANFLRPRTRHVHGISGKQTPHKTLRYRSLERLQPLQSRVPNCRRCCRVRSP